MTGNEILAMIDHQRLVAQFMELARINSESGREGALAALLQQKLETLGLAVYRQSVQPRQGMETGNVIATLAGNAAAPPLLFCAHMDTVSPGRQVEPVEERGLIRSAGETVLGADDKAGIAAILEALRVLRERRLPHGDLEFVFTVGEEVGLTGAKMLDSSRLQARLGFVLDSGDPLGTIINRGPSQDRIVATVIGVAAHAGTSPETGINAILVAAQALAAMKLGRIDAETTANIGVISGGRAINIVPEMVTLQGETRSLVEAKRIRQTELICEQLEIATRAAGAKLHLDVETIYPAMWVPPDSDVVRLAQRAAGDLGYKPRVQSTGGGSDAHFLNAHGLPSLNLGIGMKNVHTVDEYIAVEDLVGAAAYALALISAAREGGY